MQVRHLTIWQHRQALDVALSQSLNTFGPFELFSTVDVCRHPDCANYDGCLTMAAANKWASFSCKGCRKAAHGTFEEESC